MNQKESCAIVKELVTACHPFMDRFTLWADADISFLNLQKLTNYESRDKIKPTITYQRMEFNSSYKYKAEFFQLNIPQLQYLQKTLSKASVNYFINYIEVSYEFITQSIKDAENVGNIINSSLIRIRRTKAKDKNKDKAEKPKAHYHYEPNGNNGYTTRYWGESGIDNIIPVTYYDRPSKSTNEPCFKLEFRVYEKGHCEKLNLSVPSDLPQYNYECFFTQNAKFSVQIRKSDLGRAFAIDDKESITSNRGYEKYRDTKFEEKFKGIKNPPMQQMLATVKALPAILKEEKYVCLNEKYTNNMQKVLMKKLIT